MVSGFMFIAVDKESTIDFMFWETRDRPIVLKESSATEYLKKTARTGPMYLQVVLFR